MTVAAIVLLIVACAFLSQGHCHGILGEVRGEPSQNRKSVLCYGISGCLTVAAVILSFL